MNYIFSTCTKYMVLSVFFSLQTLSLISQNQPIELSRKSVYKINIRGVESFDKADLLSRQIEKLQLAIFSYVDPITGFGYFIVENNEKEVEIQSTVNSENGCSVISSQKIDFTDELFLEMYMKRSGFNVNEFSTNIPIEVVLGPNKELTRNLFSQAIAIWKNNYLTTYNKSIGVAYHHPIFINTGDSDDDNLKFEQEKQNWLTNYPDEVEQMTGRSFKDATEKEHPNDIKKAKSSNY